MIPVAKTPEAPDIDDTPDTDDVPETNDTPAPEAPEAQAAMINPVTFWDGKFLQFRARTQAITDALAGLGQIFTGPNGYQPGFYMAPKSKFPLPPVPAPTLSGINPATAVVNTGAHPIVLTGTDFTADDFVTFDGVEQPTIFVNATTLNATIPASAAVVTIQVAVKDRFGRATVNRAFTYTATA